MRDRPTRRIQSGRATIFDIDTRQTQACLAGGGHVDILDLTCVAGACLPPTNETGAAVAEDMAEELIVYQRGLLLKNILHCCATCEHVPVQSHGRRPSRWPPVPAPIRRPTWGRVRRLFAIYRNP